MPTSSTPKLTTGPTPFDPERGRNRLLHCGEGESGEMDASPD